MVKRSCGRRAPACSCSLPPTRTVCASRGALGRAMSLRRAEAERKKAMHDALLDDRYDVGAVAYLQ